MTPTDAPPAPGEQETKTPDGGEPLSGPQSVPDPPEDDGPPAPEDEPEAGFPGDGEPPEDPPAIPGLEIEGVKQLNMSVGGQRVDESQAKLRGGSLAITGGGQFDKGAFVDLTVRCRVAEVHFVDHRDKQSGEVTGVIRRHVLIPERVERV